MIESEESSKFTFPLWHESSSAILSFLVAFLTFLAIYLGAGLVPTFPGVAVDGTRQLKILHLGVAKSGSRPACVAQNMDLEAFRDSFQIVLHIAANQSLPEQFVFTSAGLIAANGINNRSTALACNTLLQLSASRDGLPVAFIVRAVLAQTKVGDAVRFIKEIKHASGQNYILGVGDHVYDFEASAGRVVEYRPTTDGSVVYHTNHRLVNDDHKPWHLKQMQFLSREERNKGSSETRLASLKWHLGQPASAIDERLIEGTLRSKYSELHAVCRTLKEGHPYFTFGATIMTLSDAPSFEATMGPPDVNPFVKMRFEHIPEAK
jgi:hypothetical protein